MRRLNDIAGAGGGGGAVWRGNEPAGLTQRVDSDFNFVFSTASGDEFIGIDGIAGVTGNTTGNVVSVTDQTDAPYSAPRAMRTRYPEGWGDGNDAGSIYGTFPAGTTKTYACFWIKHNLNFEWNPTSDKTFIWDGDVILQAKWGSHWLNIVWGAWEYPPNQDITPNLDNDDWHLVEFYCDTVAGDIRVWWNGDLTSDYTGIGDMAATRNEWKFLATWGGGGGLKTQTDYRYVDHLFVSSAV